MERIVLRQLDRNQGEMLLNMGPHHPSTLGVINFLLQADGEIIKQAIPEVGYLHRGMEKIAEQTAYHGYMPYTDRVDYLAAIFANHGYALAVERLAGIEVPPRAEYLRVIASELNRIASHLIAVGSMVMDLGAFTPFLLGIREREKLNDFFEELVGSRLTYNYVRIGGVAHDLTPGFAERVLGFLDRFIPFLEEYDRLISYNEIFVGRLANIGVIDAGEATAWGLSGPNIRSSGVSWDLRRDDPYSVYPDLEFDVVVGKGWRGVLGDCYDRYYARIDEMRQSVRILRQAFARIPEGDIVAPKVPRKLKPPAGASCYAAVESARGELGYWVASDGTDRPTRLKIRTGSFTAMEIIKTKSRGLMIADLVALISSLDVVAPEIDR